MRVVLTDVQQGLISAWEKVIDGMLPPDHDVETYHGSIFDLEVDALVSPANSFGFMDGGLDALITMKFGRRLQERLQERIADEKTMGELLVGQAMVLSTGDSQVPFVISAPTMRIPTILGNRSVNTYLATKAATQIAMREGFSSIAIPGMGTGVGRVPFDVCAIQMVTAIKEAIEGLEPPKSWSEASHRHQRLYTELTRDLQHDAR
tara:strand:+ start:9971 stop:10588 length:618 start_codon:yes stop_codon:yes gene_type:complete